MHDNLIKISLHVIISNIFEYFKNLLTCLLPLFSILISIVTVLLISYLIVWLNNPTILSIWSDLLINCTNFISFLFNRNPTEAGTGFSTGKDPGEDSSEGLNNNTKDAIEGLKKNPSFVQEEVATPTKEVIVEGIKPSNLCPDNLSNSVPCENELDYREHQNKVFEEHGITDEKLRNEILNFFKK